jgi:hypothetical protein
LEEILRLIRFGPQKAGGAAHAFVLIGVDRCSSVVFFISA